MKLVTLLMGTTFRVAQGAAPSAAWAWPGGRVAPWQLCLHPCFLQLYHRQDRCLVGLWPWCPTRLQTTVA